MTKHIAPVKVCSTCLDPVNVEICNIPDLVSCTTVDTQVSTSTFLGNMSIPATTTTVTIEENGPEPVLLYQFAAASTVTSFESLYNLALGADSVPDNQTSGLIYSAAPPNAPFPSALISSIASYDRVSPTSFRIRWRRPTSAEAWTNSFIGASGYQTWINWLVTQAEGSTFTVTVAGVLNWLAATRSGGVSVETLPVSIPCGVVISNADSLADAIATAIAPSSGGSFSDTEVVEELVCDTATNTVLIRRTTFTNGAAGTPAFFTTTFAPAAAPAAFTIGPCQQMDMETDYVCAANVTLRRVRVVDAESGTLVSETFFGANGAAVAAPAVFSQGPCSGFGTYTDLRCGATSDTTTTASVVAQRVSVENDVILTKACPTTTTGSSTRSVQAVNAAVVVAATAIPANARAVTVYNVTRAVISITIGAWGTHIIPPNATHNITLPDNVPAWSGNWSVANVAGNAGPNVFGIPPSVIVDWISRV